jgi:hypothetical protein
MRIADKRVPSEVLKNQGARPGNSAPVREPLKLGNQKNGRNEVTRQVNPTGSSHKKTAKNSQKLIRTKNTNQGQGQVR